MPQQSKTTQGSVTAHPPREALENACLRMADASLAFKNRCDEFHALLLVSPRDPGVIRLAQAAVRTAGMQSMGSVTAYLQELSQHMKAVEETEGWTGMSGSEDEVASTVGLI